MSVISIEGNIGAGKSTLLSILNAQAIKEPVDQWENTGGNNLLQRYYADPKRWAFTFQLNAIHTRCQLWENAIKQTNGDFLFSERSPLADRYIFGEIMEKQGNFSSAEYAVYDSVCRTMLKSLPLKSIIYLKCGPEKCLQRIKKRNRKGEEGIGLDYLQKVHERHQAWINRQKDCQILTLNTEDYDFERAQDQEIVKGLIQDFIQSLSK